MPSTAQPAPETDEKKTRGLGRYVVWAFVAMMVYVLSYGPALRLLFKGVLPIPVFNSVYRPLNWANTKTPFHKPLAMYLHLWCPEHIDRNGQQIRVR